MNSYFSLLFAFAFLPLSILAYGTAPKKARWAVLLGASYLFFWFLSGALVAFIAASTASVYLCGLGMARMMAKRDELVKEAPKEKRRIKKECKRRMKLVLAAGVAVNIGMLVALKYLGFFSGTFSSLLALAGISVPTVVTSIGVPIGISFYTLMAVSYLVDVYRETVQADRNIARIALFLSFFPQIMEGPICRYGQTAQSLFAGEPLKRENLYAGSLRILYGVAKKVVVADRLNAFIKPVFDNYASYDGGVIALAAVLYTFQLYCDFSGTMDVAIGIARIFNVELPENFRQPFFSRTASEFWKRWHITLGTWFKDYVYYPVSLSKPCKALTSSARKKLGNRYGPLLASSVALLAVWVGNGLWHGAGSQYLFFGLYYFVMIMAGGLIEPVSQSWAAKLGIDRNCAAYRAFQIARTLVVIFVGELFFRANGLQAGLGMFSIMVGNFTLDSFLQGRIFSMGLDLPDFAIVVVSLLGVLAVGLAKERGKDPLGSICSRSALPRWSVWIALALFIVVFGAYGRGYTPVDPMYAQF